MARGQSNSPDGGADRLNLVPDGADLPANPVAALVLGGAREAGATQTVQPRSWRWLLMGLSSCCALGSVAAAALLWMFMLPPAPNCQSISPLATDMEHLYCAQEAARSGNLPELLAGLEMVEAWSPDHPLYHEAQRWVEDWSESVLAIAHEKMAANDLPGALATARQIPRTSPVFADAQTAIAQWQGWRQEGEAVAAEVRAALKAQQWDVASAKIRSMTDSAHRNWNTKQPNALTQQLAMERRARQALTKAISLAKPGTFHNLSAAIAAASQIDPKTYAWADVQTALNRWSDTLLSMGFAQWQAQRLDQAIATAQRVLSNPGRNAEAQNLIRLSTARKLVLTTITSWQPSPQHSINLMEAIAAARQIPPSSRFYAQAQDSLASWQVQLEGVRTLQMAQITAMLGQPDALKLAIAQAQTIAPSHPRRVQAQTMIAHWQHEQERLADNPLLVRARRLATPGTIAAMRLAIAQANQVPMGHALRGEAQGLVYDWTRQIETIEDRPYLSMAQTLSRQGRLADAIRSAALVRPGRALHPQAQAAIRSWRADLHRAARQAIAVSTPRLTTATPTPPPQHSPQNPAAASSQPTSLPTRSSAATAAPTAARLADPAAQPQPAAGEHPPSPNASRPPAETHPPRSPSSAAELAPAFLRIPTPVVEPPAERVPSAVSDPSPPVASPLPVPSD